MTTAQHLETVPEVTDCNYRDCSSGIRASLFWTRWARKTNSGWVSTCSPFVYTLTCWTALHQPFISLTVGLLPVILSVTTTSRKTLGWGVHKVCSILQGYTGRTTYSLPCSFCQLCSCEGTTRATAPAPPEVLAEETCSSSCMTTQPVWLQQKLLSSNPNYRAGTALWVVF